MIVAFTGAGISKASNIPTFMEQPSVRDKLFRSYAEKYPVEYNQTIRLLWENMQKAKPNDAHGALAEYNVPIITMNIDGLHQQAGSDALELHGGMPKESELAHAHTLYNKPVLYGDAAPNYSLAYLQVAALNRADTLLIIGVSGHTMIANELETLARKSGAKIIKINANAETEVRRRLEQIVK